MGGNGEDLFRFQYVARVGKAGQNVFASYTRVVFRYLRVRPALCEEVHDELNRKAASFEHRFTDENLGVNRDSILPAHGCHTPAALSLAALYHSAPGMTARTASVEITWPSGQRDLLKNLKANATYTIEEGGRILAARPFKR